ncbi:hypothetical protein A0H81_00894 [Grifola frondosa]|uniref:Uncharacterized protein n=1 Tax=Grifola frondosa TaxID=5627 RepID=A0A1C7MY35_GRIFR|nr:hypothetical protein A0H81_00894 [Grifola frondosa]
MRSKRHLPDLLLWPPHLITFPITQSCRRATGEEGPSTVGHLLLSSSSSPASTSTAFSPPQERLTTFDDLRAAPSPPAPSTRSSRRSMSFDWKSFSMFGGGDKEKKPEPSAHLRPLTLRAGTNPVVTGARKLDTLEDEEDRRERERLHATMKLMGIDKPVSPATPAMGKSYTSPAPAVDLSGSRTPLYTGPFTPGTAVPSSAVSSPAPSTARFSFFRRNSSLTPSETPSAQTSVYGSSLPSGSRGTTPDLTQEALAQAEAENTIAALDAHERQLSAEIAKGAGSGFTEIVRRSGDRRSSRRSGESGSTVWSAGMSKAGDASD